MGQTGVSDRIFIKGSLDTERDGAGEEVRTHGGRHVVNCDVVGGIKPSYDRGPDHSEV